MSWGIPAAGPSCAASGRFAAGGQAGVEGAGFEQIAEPAKADMGIALHRAQHACAGIATAGFLIAGRLVGVDRTPRMAVGGLHIDEYGAQIGRLEAHIGQIAARLQAAPAGLLQEQSRQLTAIRPLAISWP